MSVEEIEIDKIGFLYADGSPRTAFQEFNRNSETRAVEQQASEDEGACCPWTFTDGTSPLSLDAFSSQG